MCSTTSGSQADWRVRDARGVGDETDDSTGNQIDEPQPLSGLTGFQRDVLFVVASLDGTNPNGVKIKSQLRETYDDEINHGRLYQNLRELVDEGLIEKRLVDGRTNAYRASVAAREYLEAHAAWDEWCLMDDRTDEATGTQ